MSLSLKLKLSLLIGFGTAVLAGVAAYGIWKTATSAAEERTDAMLRSPGRRLTERTGWNTDWQRFDRSLTLVFGDHWLDDGICRVVGHGPRYPVYYESANWPEDLILQHPEDAEIPPKPGGMGAEALEVRDPFLYDAETWPDHQWRMVNLANSDLTIHLGVRTDAIQRRLNQLALRLTVGASALTLLMSTIAWFVARQSLRPVGQIVRAAESISGRQLNQRIPASHRSDAEFAKLTAVFNAMFDRLERSFHQATRFSADASHELKTPITNLFATVTSRLQRCPPGSDEQRFLAGMVQELDRIRSVLGGLLLLSKADAGQLDLSQEAMGLTNYLREAHTDFADMAEAAGLRFEAELNLEEGIELSADSILLNQALHNLVRNAIDYNRPGGYVRLEANRVADEIVLRIANSGEAIPPSMQVEMFDRFRKGPRGGQGLGLNIVSEIIRAHGGRFALVSSCDEETVFEVVLPLRKEATLLASAPSA